MSDFQFSQTFKVEHREIGGAAGVYIVAEAGVSHLGDEKKAFELVDLAKKAGADAVKFQIFDVNALISNEALDWKERLGPRQLPYEAFGRISEYCKAKGITFFATAHDEPSLEFLCTIDVPLFKIGSGEIGNWPFIQKIASFGKPLIISVGMYAPAQISKALESIASTGNSEIVVLHCVTDYPTNPEDVALNNIKLLNERFKIITGYSDHTSGYHIPLAAIAMGASVIEKHITLEYNIPNAQDWKVSCGPDNFADFVNQARAIEAAMHSRDRPTTNENNNFSWASKSIVAARDISIGEILKPEMLTFKRPGTGIPPDKINELIGKSVGVEVKVDELLRFKDIN